MFSLSIWVPFVSLTVILLIFYISFQLKTNETKNITKKKIIMQNVNKILKYFTWLTITIFSNNQYSKLLKKKKKLTCRLYLLIQITAASSALLSVVLSPIHSHLPLEEFDPVKRYRRSVLKVTNCNVVINLKWKD